MKKMAITFCAAAMMLLSKTTKAQDTKIEKQQGAIDSATMMKNWENYMTVSDMHKMMASWNGTWVAEMTMWQPGAPEQKTKGITVNKMVLGGRYQESIHTSNIMGMPFEGHGTLGYDNAKKMFENIWIDNMGTGIIKMIGAWDATTKSITLTGKMIDPSTMQEMNYKEIFTVINNNTQKMEMYGPGPDGKEFKMMEIRFTRKK